ncbi:uncharacterized protein LOC126714874 [Quercus robur]|uniref:uncharacterized protein LOC126714874 n=1 Tax=Quercus robur TaxID=38942 RepID=UPI0021638034|nr:uncharacterized protein LOC126714874 [Quercus robur]
MIDIYLLTKYYSIIIIYWMRLYTGMKNTIPDYDSVVSKRKRERDIMKIPEILNGKVIHLEHQPAFHRPIMHPKEDQPALRRPIMHPEEDWPALCRPTMHPEEDQPALHRPIMQPEEDQPALHRPTMHPEEDHRHPMHPEEDEPAIRVYRVNCASVVGISSVEGDSPCLEMHQYSLNWLILF